MIAGLVALVLGLWGARGLSLWRDEAVTAGVARRPVGDILRFVSDIDAVHAAYYLLMHGVISLFGMDELVLRLPSIVAFAGAAAGIAALGSRLVSPLGGLLAGLLYALSPFASRYAHEARSYAIVTALTVGVTLLFVRAVESGTWRRWGLYGAGLTLLGAMHLFALLIVPAHLVSLLAIRRTSRGFLVSVAAATLALTPLIVVAAAQREVLGWLARPGPSDLLRLADAFAGSRQLLVLIGAAALAGLMFGSVEIRVLALPRLLVPAATLMVVSQFSPCYLGRYVIGQHAQR